jgi:hypothetical protein
MMLFFILVSYVGEDIMAQDHKDFPQNKRIEVSVCFSQQQLAMPSFDTAGPVLVRCGKGLMYYDWLCQQYQDKRYVYQYPKNDKPLLMRASYTDLELEILNQNLLFIDKQYQIQIREWIRMDKMDLNLGEAIKGFYMKPVF